MDVSTQNNILSEQSLLRNAESKKQTDKASDQKKDLNSAQSATAQNNFNIQNDTVETTKVEKLKVSEEEKQNKEAENQKLQDFQENIKEKNSEEKSKMQNFGDDTMIQFKIVESKNEETGATSKELVVFLLEKQSGKVVRRIPPELFSDPGQKGNMPSSGIFIDQQS